MGSIRTPLAFMRGRRVIVKKARGHGGRPVWYDRKKSKTGHRTRQYHAFGLALVVSGTGESFWRMIVGRWAIAWGYKDRRSTD
jgi:hypothetical protein